MAEIQLLGLFHEASPTAKTIDQLRQLGVPDAKITVMSSIPYKSEMLGRPKARGRVGLISLAGAIAGLMTGLVLTVGLFLLYPIVQGGQPIVPIPPTLIVLFELTMLGTMWTAFFSLLLENRFPVFRSEIYDPRITEGHIGVAAQVEETLGDKVEGILQANGAHHLHRTEARRHADVRLTLFWVAAASAVVVLGAVVILIAYDAIKISFPTQMEHQASIAYGQGPRLAVPDGSVPVQGPVLIAGQPATEPVPATAGSLQRGQVLFGINCALCHGSGGAGNGTVGAFFNPKPFDLTSDAVRNLPDAEIFLVITQGRASMPSLAENLSPEERWDVVNFVRSLK